MGSEKVKIEKIELKNVNVDVVVTSDSLKLWACSRETGVNVLRIKTLLSGVEIHHSPKTNDIVITKKVT